MAVAAIAALSSCDKNSGIIGGGNDFTMDAPVFTATIEGNDATKTTLANGTKVNWESNDEVKMIYANSDESSSFPVIYQATPGANATTATLSIKAGESLDPQGTKLLYAVYPASFIYDTDIQGWTIPATQMYEGDGKLTNVPMIYYNLNNSTTPIPTTSLSFKNVNAVLAITVPYSELTSVKSITVSSNMVMNGGATYDGNKGNLYIKSGPFLTEENGKITLDCYTKAGQNVAIPNGGSKTFYIAIPPMNSSLSSSYRQNDSYSYLQFDVTDGTIIKTMKTKDGVGISVERNKIYPITFAGTQTQTITADPNLLAGEFSVSPTKKVNFTKGNLWCNTTTTPVTWAFETNQYNCPNNMSNDHVWSFYWTTTAETSYALNYTLWNSASTTDQFWLDGSDAAHRLTVQGTSDLYVLSKDEWLYLFGSRTNAKSLYKCGVTINGVSNYLVIAPDNYTGSIDTSYSLSAWATAEALGLVCLPPAGCYKTDTSTNTSSISESGKIHYGSSSHEPYVNTSYYYLCLYSGAPDWNTCWIYYGSTLRLVKTVAQ